MSIHDRTFIVLGGGRGSLTSFSRILYALPPLWHVPLLATFHAAVGDAAAQLQSGGDDGDEEDDGESPLRAVRAVHRALPPTGCAFVAPPGCGMRVAEDGTVVLTPGMTEHPVDALFESAASVHGAAVVAVLLGGDGSDGVEGMRAVRRQGGRGIVEAPVSAEHAAMPAHAILGDHPNAILLADRIGPALRRLAGD